jgi:hypothetical protein
MPAGFRTSQKGPFLVAGLFDGCDCSICDDATLRDAALYITELPKAEHDAAEWQAAMEALLLVAESGGPTMFARIGVMRALNRHVEREFNPSRKETHWGRRKLARDR